MCNRHEICLYFQASWYLWSTLGQSLSLLHRWSEYASVGNLRSSTADWAHSTVHGFQRVVRSKSSRWISNIGGHQLCLCHGSTRVGENNGGFRLLSTDIVRLCRGGRNPVTPRLTRHFNFLSFTELENDSMRKIFTTIFNWWSSKYHIFNSSETASWPLFILPYVGQNDFLMGLSEKLIMSSIEVYKTICASLLPTPSKSHYTFNLRDLSKVFQGMLMMESKKVDVRDKLCNVIDAQNVCLDYRTSSSSVVSWELSSVSRSSN